MTIHRDKGKVVFECDECGEDYNAQESVFDEAWQAAKADGWVSYKLGSEWHHFCPDCKGKDAT
jgi:hypothetical protein